MSKYVIDAWAWIEYLIGSERGVKVREVLEQESIEVYTCAITLAEVISKVAREGRDVDGAYALLLGNSQVVNVNEDLSLEAGLLHFEMRKTSRDFGLADAYVLATARKLKSKILTGDLHFRDVKEAVLINKVRKREITIPEELFKEMVGTYFKMEQLLATLETLADEESLRAIEESDGKWLRASMLNARLMTWKKS